MQSNNKIIIDKLTRIENELVNTKTVLSPSEAADYIGITLSHLYKLTSSRLIPFSKPNGKMIFFSRAELDEWLLSSPVKTSKQLESEAAIYSSKNH